jgi:hypothetical protein
VCNDMAKTTCVLSVTAQGRRIDSKRLMDLSQRREMLGRLVTVMQKNFAIFKLLGILMKTSSSSFFFDSKLLSRGEGVLEHRLGPPRSIDRGSRLRE